MDHQRNDEGERRPEREIRKYPPPVGRLEMSLVTILIIVLIVVLIVFVAKRV